MKAIPDNFIVVAKVIKSYGTEGAVTIRFSDSQMHEIEGPVFIFFDGFPVPFFIETSVPKGSGALIKFETVNDLSHAEELVGRDINIELSKGSRRMMASIEGNDQGQFSFLCGYEVMNEDDAIVGIVEKFLDYPGNPCLEISTDSNQDDNNDAIIIPLHSDLIIDINEKKRLLKMKIPVGLENINK